MSRIIVPVSKAKPDQEWKNPSWPPRVPAGLHVPQSTKDHFGETRRYVVPPPPDDYDSVTIGGMPTLLVAALALFVVLLILLAVWFSNPTTHPTPAHPLPKEPACLNRN